MTGAPASEGPARGTFDILGCKEVERDLAGRRRRTAGLESNEETSGKWTTWDGAALTKAGRNRQEERRIQRVKTLNKSMAAIVTAYPGTIQATLY